MNEHKDIIPRIQMSAAGQPDWLAAADQQGYFIIKISYSFCQKYVTSYFNVTFSTNYPCKK